MKKLPSILLLFITFNFCYSQSLVERWNQYNNRYEYFNSYGNIVAYKVYNQYKNQWEIFNVNSQNDYPKVQSSVNLPLIQQALVSKQQRYDKNKETIQSCINSIFDVFKTLANNNETYIKISNRFTNEYVNEINNIPYDLSSDAISSSILKYLLDGSKKIIREENN